MRGGPVRSVVAVGAALALVIVLASLGSGPAPPPGRGPDGTLALRRLLEGLGARLLEGGDPRPGEALVLLNDDRTDAEATEILDWVAEGGHLVLADPSSSLVVRLGAEAELPPGEPLGTVRLSPACGAPTAVAGSIEAAEPVAALRLRDPAAVSCYPVGGGAFELVRPFGSGEAVLLGNSSPLTNRLLDRAGNAAFAVSLMGGRSAVRFGTRGGPPPVVAHERGLWGSLPLAAQVVIAEIALAAAAFAVVRARRLGSPVLEEPMSPIPAGELVQATARLYRRARATSFSGQLMRQGAGARLARRLGVSPARPEEVTAAAARASGLTEARVHAALAGADPVTDDQLLALGRDLEEVSRAMEEARG